MKISFLIVAIIGLIMGLTNPSQEDYLEDLVWDLKENFCVRNNLEVSKQVSCTTLKTVPPAIAQRIFKEYSRRQNYLFFSIYTTDLGGLRNRSIGIFGQVIKIKH